MGWISERILAERRKHDHNGIDWVRIAEAKIKLQIKEMIRECPDIDYVGEFLIKKFDSEIVHIANKELSK